MNNRATSPAAGINRALGWEITIRPAFPDDQVEIRHLADLDEKPTPEAPLLIAEVRGELGVAVSVATLGSSLTRSGPAARSQSSSSRGRFNYELSP